MNKLAVIAITLVIAVVGFVFFFGVGSRTGTLVVSSTSITTTPEPAEEQEPEEPPDTLD